MDKILIVSPHPDDETLGAGGTLLHYKSQNNKIYWLNITNVNIEYGYNEKKVEKRKEEIDEVIKKYGFDKFFDLALCPAKLQQYDSNEIIEKISNVIKEIEPTTIILPNSTDVHSDHRIVFEWCYSCTKIFRYPHLRKILSMEILSETDFAVYENGFVPNYFIDISNEFNKKIEILKIYNSELGKHPFPRSIEGIEALAKYRGISAGCKYAEAFKVIKIIE